MFADRRTMTVWRDHDGLIRFPHVSSVRSVPSFVSLLLAFLLDKRYPLPPML